MSGYIEHYEKMLEQADKEYPGMENRSCDKCGLYLVKGSYNYDMGEHIDGCPGEE